MTVHDLITKLNDMPQDAQVILYSWGLGEETYPNFIETLSREDINNKNPLPGVYGNQFNISKKILDRFDYCNNLVYIY